MRELTFYSNPQSRGRIVHWMLEELAEPYNTVWIDYSEGIKSAEYLAINPMGKVPAVKHGDAVITECPAICAYLASVFPAKQLIPAADDPQLASFYRWLFFAGGPLEMVITVKNMKWDVTPESSRTLGFGNFQDTFDALEKALTPGPYICGEQFTAADVYVGASVYWGLSFGAIEKRPVFEAYSARLNERPALQKANKINDEKVAQSA